MGKAKQNKAQLLKPETKLKILVSSTVYGHEELLESVYSLLTTYGYEVLMSHKGTIPVDPDHSAMDSCLDAVEACDLFLGIILPSYGTGKEASGEDSITHREMIEAISLNKPRWFLVHEHVAVARLLLQPYRVEDKQGNPIYPAQLDGIGFQKTPVLSDLRVIDMFELAMRHDVPAVKDRRGNWVQQFGPDEDARLFSIAQFRRYRDLAEKHLPKLADKERIKNQVKRGEA